MRPVDVQREDIVAGSDYSYSVIEIDRACVGRNRPRVGQDAGLGAVDVETPAAEDGDRISAKRDRASRPGSKTADEVAARTHDRDRSVPIQRRDLVAVDEIAVT